VDIDACPVRPVPRAARPLVLLRNYLLAVRRSGMLVKPDACDVVTHTYDLVSLILGVGSARTRQYARHGHETSFSHTGSHRKPQQRSGTQRNQRRCDIGAVTA